MCARVSRNENLALWDAQRVIPNDAFFAPHGAVVLLRSKKKPTQSPFRAL